MGRLSSAFAFLPALLGRATRAGPRFSDFPLQVANPPPPPASSAALPPLGATARRLLNQLGIGTANWASQETIKLFGPYNPNWVPDYTLKLMGGDWQISFAREIWMSAYSSVEYRFVKGDPKIRAFLEEIVMPRLAQWIEVALLSLDFGRQVAEIVWQLQDVAWEWTDGDGPGKTNTKTATKRGAYVPDDLRDLDPIECTILLDAMGDYAGTQHLGHALALPPEKTIVFVNDSLFGNLHGQSLRARAYSPWWEGNLCRNSMNRYLQNKGDPPLIATAPGVEEVDEAGNPVNPLKIMGAATANVRGGASFTIPAEFDPQSKLPLYSVKCLEVAARAEEFLPWFDRQEALKRLAYLIPGDIGGGVEEGAGAFAKTKISQDVVHKLFDRRKRRVILDPLNKWIFPKIIAANFGKVKPGDVPILAAGDMGVNTRAEFLDLLKSAMAMETITPDGRRVKVVECLDMIAGLKRANLPAQDLRLVPDAPETDIKGDLIDGGARDTAGSGAPPKQPGPGRPSKIAPETNRAPAPGRPGAGLSRGQGAEDDEEDADAKARRWYAAALLMLSDFDDRQLQVERVASAHAESIQTQIRATLQKHVAAAGTTRGADGKPDMARDAALSDRVERDVAKVVDRGVNEDLLGLDQIEPKMLAEPLTPKEAAALPPMAAQHVGAFHDATRGAEAMGLPTPGPADAKKIVAGIARDAARNGRGIVVREARRAAETMHRAATSGAEVRDAIAAAAAHGISAGDFARATEDHVRAVERATLAWSGEKAGATRWAVGLGPRSEAAIIDKAPTGQIAPLAWTDHSADDLDALYRQTNAERATWSSWKDLGLKFGSEEYYLPLPTDPAVMAIALGLLAAKRQEFNRARAERQATIDRLNAPAPTPAAIHGGS